ncbi:hypothetical protein AII33_02240 [Salmonella enterica]|nr:hypothetical protein [Salmonella enterica]
MHGFACVFLPHFLQTAPFPAWPERVSATALKPPRKAGGRGGESTARRPCYILNKVHKNLIPSRSCAKLFIKMNTALYI